MHSNLNEFYVRFDRTLGGVEFQLRLRDYLAEQFNKVKRTKKDVTTDARAMQKLFKEAGRVKQVLSANTDHFAQVAPVSCTTSHSFILFVKQKADRGNF